jgi:hypothetical protein
MSKNEGGLLTINAQGRGKPSDNITWANGRQLLQATWKPLAGLPTQVVNDKGRYRQHPATATSRASLPRELSANESFLQQHFVLLVGDLVLLV